MFYRAILNVAMVEAAIRAEHPEAQVQTVYGEDMDFKQQVQAAASASVSIQLHSPSLANWLFLPKVQHLPLLLLLHCTPWLQLQQSFHGGTEKILLALLPVVLCSRRLFFGQAFELQSCLTRHQVVLTTRVDNFRAQGNEDARQGATSG